VTNSSTSDDEHVPGVDANDADDDDLDSDNSADDSLSAAFAIVDSPTAFDADGKPFTVYVISFLARDGSQRTAVRRYNQFAQLHKELCDFFPKQQLPRLTSKRFINNRSADTIEKRRRKLQRYLNDVAAKPSLLYSEQVERFLYQVRDIDVAASSSSNSLRRAEQQMHLLDSGGVSASSSTTASPAARRPSAATPSPLADKDELMKRKMQEIMSLQQQVSIEQAQRRRTSDVHSSTLTPAAASAALPRSSETYATAPRRDSFSLESAVLLSPRQLIETQFDALERVSSAGRSATRQPSPRHAADDDDAGDESPAAVVRRERSSSAARAVAAAAADMEQRTGASPLAAAALAESSAPLPRDADAAMLCKALLLGRHAALAEHFASLKDDAERTATTNKMRELLDEIRGAHERRVCVAQRAVRCMLARRALAWRRSARQRRSDVVNELLRTEVSYVKGLAVLTFRYLEPLTAAVNDKSSGLLNEPDVRVILGDLFVSDMHQANVALRDALHPVVAGWTPWSCVGRVLATHLDGFRDLYSTYYANFDASNELLGKRLRTLDKFRQFCEAVQADTERLDLVSFLITPIQRLPRYALLIEQLIAATPPEHPDADALTDALVVSRSLVTRSNRHMQCRAQLLRWGAELGTRGPQPFCAATRFMLSRNECKLAVKDEKWTDTTFAVLSDHLLIIHSKGKHRLITPLHHCWARRFGGDNDAELEVLSVGGASMLRFANSERRDSAWQDICDGLSTLLDVRVSGCVAASQERAAIDPLLDVFVHSRRPSSRADVDLFDACVVASTQTRALETGRLTAVLRYGPKAGRMQRFAPVAPPLAATAGGTGAAAPASVVSPRAVAARATSAAAAAGAPAPIVRTSSFANFAKPPGGTASPLSPRSRTALLTTTSNSPLPARRIAVPTVLSSPLETRRQATLLPPPNAGGPQTKMAVALHAFAAQRRGDLALQKGDIIENVEVSSTGWWRGHVARTGAQGQFPATYVRPINFVLPPEDVEYLATLQRNAVAAAAAAKQTAATAALAPAAAAAGAAPATPTSTPTVALTPAASPASVARAISPTNVDGSRVTLSEQAKRLSLAALRTDEPSSPVVDASSGSGGGSKSGSLSRTTHPPLPATPEGPPSTVGKPLPFSPAPASRGAPKPLPHIAGAPAVAQQQGTLKKLPVVPAAAAAASTIPLPASPAELTNRGMLIADDDLPEDPGTIYRSDGLRSDEEIHPD
jgi:hypothetical protein